MARELISSPLPGPASPSLSGADPLSRVRHALASRRLSRHGGWLAGAALLFCVGLLIRSSSQVGGVRAGFTGPISAVAQKEVEDELIRILVKQKEALEAKTSVEDIVGYADRFIVLQEIDAFSDSLPTRYPGLNATTLATYQRSLAFHHEKLFQQLFPYISRSPSSPRTLATLRRRYSRPEGIVIPCGRDQFQFAVHLIATLKHVLRTTLPIQVVYAGNDDLPMDRRNALRSIAPDVETFDLLHLFDEDWVGLQGGGWAIKVFAILASPFERVIICDSDAVFIQDPRVMFDNPGYIKTGTLFFRDREIFPGDGNVHDWWAGITRGRTPSEMMAKSRWYTDRASREEMESGVVVFDKSRKEVLMGLIYVGYLNTKRVREPVTYSYTYGDKESFWMGFELVQIPYHMDPLYAAIIGQLTHPDKKHSTTSALCSDHLTHLDEKGRLLWWNGSLMQEKRKKERGWLFATHWAYGTVEWACEFEPWCMVGIREKEAFLLTEDEHSILNHMIGTSMAWEGKFPGLIG